MLRDALDAALTRFLARLNSAETAADVLALAEHYVRGEKRPLSLAEQAESDRHDEVFAALFPDRSDR